MHNISMHILVLSTDKELTKTLRKYFEERKQKIIDFSLMEGLPSILEDLRYDLVVVESLYNEKEEIIDPEEIVEKFNFTAPVIIYSEKFDPVKFYTQIHSRGKADELILKHEGIDALIEKIEKILKETAYEADVRPRISALYDSIYSEPPMLIAFSPIMKAQLSKAAYLSREKHLHILITGETGTGKELMARFIHRLSCPDGPFIAMNCADFKGQDLNIARSELFGHVKGAYTGASQDRKGAFERACGGILFLDEIEELPLPVQAELLRVVQEKIIIPLGGEKEKKVDVRIVCATNKSLEYLLSEGILREDLYFRLAGGIIELPPLRERGKTEIDLLVEHFLRKYRPSVYIGIAPEFLEALYSYDWPGNVRELEQLILRTISLLGSNGLLTLDLLPQDKFSVKSIRERYKEIILNKIKEVVKSIDISTLSCEDILELKEEFEALLFEPVFLKCGFNFSKLARELQTTKDLRKRKSAEILRRKYILKRPRFGENNRK